jgi:hypothetical protein
MQADRFTESAVRLPVPSEMEVCPADLGRGDVTHLRIVHGVEWCENLDDLAVTMLEPSLSGAFEGRLDIARRRESAEQERGQDRHDDDGFFHGQTVSRNLAGVHDVPHLMVMI